MIEPWRSNSVRSSEEVMLLLFCLGGGLAGAGAGSGVSLLAGGGAALERTLTTAAVPEALNTHTSSLHIKHQIMLVIHLAHTLQHYILLYLCFKLEN